MSLLTKASLIATPTAYGDGVLNSVKPTDGAGDFDFARASSATRVNEEGLIEKERENLLLQSNQFDTTWTLVNASVTGGHSGYDGNSDAWLLESTASGVSASVRQFVSLSGVGTFSVYAKSGNVNFIALYVASSSGAFNLWADLSSGSIGTTAGDINTTTTSAGGGWYRITLTGLNPDQRVDIYPANTNGSYLTATGENIYIQDAQLEQGLVATDYIETTTSSVAVGITNDIPRINYENGIGNFLLEPQRTNLFVQSEYISGGDWLKANTTTQDNIVTSPEGVINAAKIIENTLNSSHQIYHLASFTSGQEYTVSFFAKTNGRDIGVGMASLVFGSNSTYFDLTNGLVLSTNSEDAGIEDYGNGWYRCYVTNTANITLSDFIYILLSNNQNFTYTGDGTSGVYIYGLQLEAGYLTSYIPTYGSAVTRASETCNNAGNSDLFNDSEGVLYAEIAALVNDGTSRVISLNDGSSSNRIHLFYFVASNTIYVNYRVGGTSYAIMDASLDSSLDFNKIAYKFSSGDFALWVNGIEVDTDGNTTMIPSGTIDRLDFNSGGGGGEFYGKTKMVSTFKEALSDSELECLTSWSSFERMATAQNYTIQ